MQAEAQAELNRISFIAFSLMAVVGCSWIGAVVELTLYPRFFGKVHIKGALTSSGYTVNVTHEYSEVLAKTVGDSTHEYVGHALDTLFEHIWPEKEKKKDNDRKIELNSLATTIETGQSASSKTKIDNALSAASGVVTAQLMALPWKINKYQGPMVESFGDELVKVIQKKFPRPTGMRDNDYIISCGVTEER